MYAVSVGVAVLCFPCRMVMYVGAFVSPWVVVLWIDVIHVDVSEPKDDDGSFVVTCTDISGLRSRWSSCGIFRMNELICCYA